jgi:hypothetical protein
MSEWISVRDALPEAYQLALVWCLGKGKGKVRSWHRDLGFWASGQWWSAGVITPFSAGEVSHWMPLPEPPDGAP